MSASTELVDGPHRRPRPRLRDWAGESGLLDGRLGTAVDTGLFDFGHRDGPAEQALLQHPLAVAVLPDGSVAVCDTYNGAVRRVPLASVVEVDGFAHRTQRPVTEVAAGELEIVVDFSPPPGQKVDERFGPPSQLPRATSTSRTGACR